MNNQTWGGRFTKALEPMVVKFHASIAFDKVFFPYDIHGSKVHAQMLAKQKIITAIDAHLICEGLEKISTCLPNNLDENAEDIHMFIEQQLIKEIGEVGKKLHTGRSRNDQVALDLKLYLKDKIYFILTLLQDLQNTYNTLQNTHQNNLMPGYTHLQPAQPVFLGDYFGAYAAMNERDISRLTACLERMDYSPLGAGALAGSSLPLDREWVAQQLGFAGIVPNTLDAVSDRDFVIEFCACASLIMMHFSRLCEDLILWATREFNFITLDDAFATGSSLMPNKKNPDIPELIRGKSGRVFGHLMGLLTVMKGLPLAYNKDMQEDKEALFDTVNTLINCLSILPKFLNSLQFNTKKMQLDATTGYLDATKLVETLVLKGMPFRDAHHTVGKWVREAMDKQCPLSAIIPNGED